MLELEAPFIDSPWQQLAIVDLIPLDMGTFYFPCDYRIKKDVTPMQSTWDAVKRLN